MKSLIGLAALIFLLIGIGNMANDNWGPGLLFFGLGIGAIHLLPEDQGGGWLGIFFRR